jgi:hypothetical protein
MDAYYILNRDGAMVVAHKSYFSLFCCVQAGRFVAIRQEKLEEEVLVRLEWYFYYTYVLKANLHYMPAETVRKYVYIS